MTFLILSYNNLSGHTVLEVYSDYDSLLNTLGGFGLPIPIGPHKKTGAVERFHIAETKDSTSVRDRSMSHRLVPAASKSTYALCSGSLIRKIDLGWGSTMRYSSMTRGDNARCIEEYLCTMFRFIDKEDRFGVGVYEAILKYDPGR